MFTRENLLDLLNDVDSRHSTLKKQFEIFHSIIRSQLNNSKFSLQGAKVTTLSNDEFYIGFAGHKLRFKFSAVADPGSSILYGYIYCHLVELDEPKKVWLVEPLKFNVSGLSELAFQENDEHYYFNITDDSHATHIVLHCLYQSLSQTIT